MGRVNSRTAKHNRLIAEAADSAILREIREKRKAAEREAKMNSVEFKIEMAQRQCIQPLHKLEKEWENAQKAKVKDENKIAEAREQILRGLDKAATDTIARIMAEIKQKYLSTKGISKNEMQTVNLTIDEFYADFEKACKREFENYVVSEEEFEKIFLIYKAQNFFRIQHLGERVGYCKAAEQLEKNLSYVKTIAIKEKDLTV